MNFYLISTIQLMINIDINQLSYKMLNLTINPRKTTLIDLEEDFFFLPKQIYVFYFITVKIRREPKKKIKIINID
jgi:hypothetical protein